MRVENTVQIPAPLAKSWELIQDVPTIAPCIPGAELTEIVGQDAWKGNVRIKVGPIALQFLGDIVRTELDELAHRMVLNADGKEAKGRGHAEAVIEVTLSDAGATTEATISMDVDLQGTVAQYGRGVVADITSEILRQFADRLAALIREREADAAVTERPSTGESSAPAIRRSSVAAAPVKPIGGVRLIFKITWGKIRRALRGKRGQRASR